MHGYQCFEAMGKSGRLDRFNQWFSKELPKKHAHSLNEYTFVDLAQIVCKLPETHVDKGYLSSTDEEFDGYISEPTTLVKCTFVSQLSYVKHCIYFTSTVTPRCTASNAPADRCRCLRTRWTRTTTISTFVGGRRSPCSLPQANCPRDSCTRQPRQRLCDGCQYTSQRGRMRQQL